MKIILSACILALTAPNPRSSILEPHELHVAARHSRLMPKRRAAELLLAFENHRVVQSPTPIVLPAWSNTQQRRLKKDGVKYVLLFEEISVERPSPKPAENAPQGQTRTGLLRIRVVAALLDVQSAGSVVGRWERELDRSLAIDPGATRKESQLRGVSEDEFALEAMDSILESAFRFSIGRDLWLSRADLVERLRQMGPFELQAFCSRASFVGKPGWGMAPRHSLAMAALEVWRNWTETLQGEQDSEGCPWCEECSNEQDACEEIRALDSLIALLSELDLGNRNVRALAPRYPRKSLSSIRRLEAAVEASSSKAIAGARSSLHGGGSRHVRHTYGVFYLGSAPAFDWDPDVAMMAARYLFTPSTGDIEHMKLRPGSLALVRSSSDGYELIEDMFNSNVDDAAISELVERAMWADFSGILD